MRCLLLGLLPACFGEPGPEILRNSGFELLDEQGFAAEWTNLDDNPDGEIRIVKEPTIAGRFALQWQMAATGDGWEYFVIQHVDAEHFTPGSTYELSGWYHVDAPGEVALNYIVRGMPDFAPDISTVSDFPVYPKVAGEWARFSFEFEIPDHASPAYYEVFLHSIKFNQAATRLTLDAVTLHER